MRALLSIVVIAVLLVTPLSAQAATLQTYTTVTTLGSENGSDLFWADFATGCRVYFPLSSSPSAAAHRRAFDLLNAALLSAKRVTVYGGTCSTGVQVVLFAN